MTDTASVEPAIDSMTETVLARAAEIARYLSGQRGDAPSMFWDDIGRQNIEMLAQNGVAQFKRHVSQNYFNWVVEGPNDPKFRRLVKYWMNMPEFGPLEVGLEGSGAVHSINDTHFLATQTAERGYTLFVGLLWWWAQKGDALGPMPDLSEPLLGDPVQTWEGARRVSQDLANSRREFARFSPWLQSPSNGKRQVLAEIGAGYGRLGFFAAHAASAAYWVFDVPPALPLAEWYLGEVLPQKTIFRWRPFTRWEDVRDEVLAADLCFFTPDQLRLIPHKSVDVFAAISSLHEMTEDQTTRYMHQMAEAARVIYTKNWTLWRNEADGVEFASASVTAPDGWSTAFDRIDDVIDDFTEKLFLSPDVEHIGG